MAPAGPSEDPLRIPTSPKPVYVCVTHVPLVSVPVARQAAFTEIKNGIIKFRKLGVVIIGGDLNARCAMNGDTTRLPCGTHLMDFCDENVLTMVNSLSAIVNGEFTRVQLATRDGITSWDKTTIDYVLIDKTNASRALNLSFLEDNDLDSDHKVVKFVVQIGSTPSVSHKAAPLKKSYMIRGCSESKYAAFEDVCEPLMVDVCARARQSTVLSQAEIDAQAESLHQALSAAAQKHFGTKLVGSNTKAWFDFEIKALFELKKLAREVMLVAKLHSAATLNQARAVLKQAKRVLRSRIRTKKKQSERACFDEIERAQGQSKLFWKPMEHQNSPKQQAS